MLLLPHELRGVMQQPLQASIQDAVAPRIRGPKQQMLQLVALVCLRQAACMQNVVAPRTRGLMQQMLQASMQDGPRRQTDRLLELLSEPWLTVEPN